MNDIKTSDTVIACTNLNKVYRQGNNELTVINNLDLNVTKGEKIAIIGRSGSGKSTLLTLLGALDTPNSGEVTINNQSISALNDNELSTLRNQSLGFVYQFHHLLPEFTAIENVMMPLLIAGISQSTAIKTSERMLDKVGLSHRIKHKPAQLSGGERQRVAIARALINNPACVLMDEPTGNLDSESAQNVLELIDQLSTASHTAFVIVTHDDNVALKMDTLYRLEAGKLAPITHTALASK